MYGISFAGHDPVTALLCNTLRCLLPRRDQWEALCADPSLAAAAVEETLRFESSQVSWRRITTQPTTLGGVDLPAGTRLFLNFASANHQPDVFEEPDTFDIHRANANRHISFGKGIHFCLGAGLARIEARIALELLSQRLPSLRLAPDQTFHYFPNITFRGPDALVLEWDHVREPLRGPEVPVRTQPQRGAAAGVPGRPPRRTRPTRAAGYELTDEETRALVEPDIGLLFHLGVNGQILMHFAAFHQIEWADYLQQMRDGITTYGPVREGVYAMTGYDGVEYTPPAAPLPTVKAR